MVCYPHQLMGTLTLYPWKPTKSDAWISFLTRAVSVIDCACIRNYWGWSLLMHLNLEKHINYSNVHQTTSLFLFLEPFYINPRDHCLGKSKQNISFWNTQTTLSGTNDHVNVTSVRFLPWSEAQTMSTCLNVSCCHVIGWWDIYINGHLNRCL